MPKEVIRTEPNGFDLIVGWDNYQSVQVGVDSHRKFDWLDEDDSDGPHTSLWMMFYSAEDIDNFIKVLRRAKRKTF